MCWCLDPNHERRPHTDPFVVCLHGLPCPKALDGAEGEKGRRGKGSIIKD